MVGSTSICLPAVVSSKQGRRQRTASAQNNLLSSCRLKKALIATCMMIEGTANNLRAVSGESVMGKIVSAIVAVALAAGPLLLPLSARAENGEITAGVVGGLIGGALLGGALASRPAPPPVYYAPQRVYVEEPACRVVRERYWDGYDWVYRRV